ncbi:uncharacterized protein [Equus caballus]|uniref:uncharacterized protein n=1 Tax=Equus caballus TaxID=9796 RepID=UPI0038B35C6E
MKSTALQTKRKKSNKELEDFHDSQALDGGRRHQTDRTKKSEGQPGGACGCRAQNCLWKRLRRASKLGFLTSASHEKLWMLKKEN